MQTIWLQRSSPDIPWGFRLVGGREFGVALTVQRVTPGSVAASALGPGDVILKVGNVVATNLEHNEAQELVRQATNILQLTIRKAESSSPSGPLSPTSSMSAQLNDGPNFATTPRGFGTGIPLNSSNNWGPEPSSYATTPRNYGSQLQASPGGTRIEIKRVAPHQSPAQPQTQALYNNYPTGQGGELGGSNFPDYTIAYRKQEPIHDSPGGPVNIRAYNSPSDPAPSFGSKTLPRDPGGYDRDGFRGASGPPAYEPRPQPQAYSPSIGAFSSRDGSDPRFNTGHPLSTSAPSTQMSYQVISPQTHPGSYGYSSPPNSQGYNSQPSSNVSASCTFSPTSQYVQSQKPPTPSSGYPVHREPNTPTAVAYNQAPFYGSQEYDSPVGNYPETPSYSRPSLYVASNNSPYSQSSQITPKSFSQPPYNQASYNQPSYNQPSYNQPSYNKPSYNTPTQLSSTSAFSAPDPRSFQSPLSPGSTSYPPPPATFRRVSFDQDLPDNDAYNPGVNYSSRQFTSPPPARPTYDYPTAADYGVSSPKPASFSRQSSRPEEFQTGGPLSPRSYPNSGGRGSGYDVSGLREGLDNLNLGFEPSPSTTSAAPPPPPPPPPPGPPPPPAPLLGDYGSSAYRRSNLRSREGSADEQKVPDQLLNTMMKSAKGGGPKPFSYGIDLSELKKKIGPPTAPKPRASPSRNPDEEDDQEAARQYSGPPRRPAGLVQSDYFIKREDDQDSTPRSGKKPAGLVQSDYYQNRVTGPRSEIDESPINIHMGTDPKKQSKSFKVLQWMTETDKDDPEEFSQKPRRSKDPERRHNAVDDEMRFSGLHSKAEIPSKAFGVLQRIAGDDGSSTSQNGRNWHEDTGRTENGAVQSNPEPSVRYKGDHIPSPSFRVLQSWAQLDTDTHSPGVPRDEEEEDGLPETLSGEDLVDKRYKGANIPSKVFKVLQKSVGEDTPETAPIHSRNQLINSNSQPDTLAPISDF